MFDYSVIFRQSKSMTNTSRNIMSRLTNYNISVPRSFSCLETASDSVSFAGIDDLPAYVRADLENNYDEMGFLPPIFSYFEKLSARYNNYFQNIMQNIYIDAIRQEKHRIAWNIILLLSEFPYNKLGDWAPVIAEAALKAPYPDIVELGIRCFENWEDKKACERLKNASFKINWLQDYANEVCAYIEENGVEYTAFANFYEQKFLSLTPSHNNSSTFVKG